jgi:hypothetical protein
MLMNISRWFLALILLGLASSHAKADNIDPKFQLQGGCCSIPLTTLNDPHFMFTFTQTGGITVATAEFVNETPFTIGRVNLDITDTVPLLFSADNSVDPYFTSASPTTPTLLSPGGHLLMSFFGTNGDFPGIPNMPCDCETGLSNHFIFSMTVADVPLHGSYSFKGTLFAIPEPSTILLLLTGGVLVLFFKRS